MNNTIDQTYKEFISTHKDYEKAEQHYTNLTDEEAVVFVHKDKMIATAFSGKKATPDWTYRFKDERQRRKYIQDYFVKCKQAQELKIERAAARIKKKKEFFASIKEGDKIYYDKGRSFKMMIDGSSYTIIREDDVVVVSSFDS